MKRPVLNVGDVVRLSKRGKGNRSMFLNHVMVVEKASGDTCDGRTRVECSAFLQGNFIGKAAFKRRELWKTGYNAFAKGVVAQRTDLNPVASTQSVSKSVTNDGHTHCVKCKKPTRFVPGFNGGGYNLCQNKACPMFDK